MGQIVKGVLQSVVVKAVSGGRKAHDIVVAGETYGFGLYPPKAKEGDYIMFEVDDSRGYKNVARNSLKVSANKPPAEAVAEAASTAPKTSSTGATFDNRQDVISRQAATNTAIAYLGVLGQTGALSVPTTKGKGLEYMDTLLKKYTQEFYESNTGIAFKDISPTKAEDAEDEPTDDAPFEEAPDDAQWT